MLRVPLHKLSNMDDESPSHTSEAGCWLDSESESAKQALAVPEVFSLWVRCIGWQLILVWERSAGLFKFYEHITDLRA